MSGYTMSAEDLKEGGFGEDDNYSEIDLSALSTWEEIISDEVLEYVFGDKDKVQRERNISLLNDKAKTLHKLNDFRKISKAYADQLNRTRREEYLKNNPNGLNFTNPPILLQSDVYRGTDEGIYLFGESIIPQPVVIVKRFEDVESGEVKVELAFKHQGRWKHITTGMETIANRNKIVSLSANGLMVTTANAAEVVQYLQCLQTENITLLYEGIPTIRSISHLGYINNDFIPYSGDCIYGGESSYLPIYNAIHNKGSLDEWVNLLRETRNDSIAARTVINASLASPLLQRLNVLLFFLHLWGGTGGGKTAALRFGASVWGNPDEYMRNFNSTAVAFERTAYFFHNMPFVIDELQTIRSKYKSENANFGDIIYTLTQGQGKSRGTIHGVEKPLTWKCAFITSGEQPLTSERSSTGEYNRVLEIYENKIFENPSRVYKVSSENYGYAGREFISRLNDYDISLMAELWKGIIQEYNVESSGKQQMIMTALLVADELVNRIFMGLDENQAQDDTVTYWKMLSKQFTDITENDVIKRAYEFTVGWVAENRDKFHTLKNIAEEDGIQDLYSQWGKYSNNSKTIFISSNSLKDALAKAGYNYESTLKGFNERDYVINESVSDKHKKNTKPFRLNGMLTRGIELKANLFYEAQ